MPIGDQDKNWAPHITCLHCTRTLEGKYIRALEENLLDYYIEHNDGTWKYLHDNAHSHCGNQVKQFLSKNLIEIMDSTLYSPDLNPIENAWCYIVSISIKN